MDAYEFAATQLSPTARDAISGFWTRFALIAEPLAEVFDDKRQDFDVVGETQKALGALDWHDWEYGPGVNGGHRLCISAGWSAEHRVMARAIALAAPRLPRWTFSDVRDPGEPSMAFENGANRSGRPPGISGLRLVEADHNMIDVEIVPNGELSAEDTAAQGACVVALLLGEREERIWIGDIRPGAPGAALNPQETVEAFARLKQDIQARLPDQPWTEIDLEGESLTWSSIKRDLPESPSPFWRHDMYVGITPFHDRLTAATSAPFFMSERYSRFGETFAYLKIDGTQDDPLGQIEDRAGLEDAIAAALAPRGLGKPIGGGTGHWFSYVELALTHTGEAIDALRAALQAAGIGKAAWVHFDEPGLETFYAPIWPDSPPPPMPERQ